MLADSLIRPGVEPCAEPATAAGMDVASQRSVSVIAEPASVIGFTSGCDLDEAFEALSRQSCLQQMAMRDLAAAVVYEQLRSGRDSHEVS